jgi:hypothetical protein
MQQPNNHGLYVLEKISSASLGSLAGTVQRVDLVQREITVDVGAQQVDVDVPPQCPVVLRGERIKLRIIQVGDVVRISLTPRAARCVAQCVEVAPINSLPATGDN